MKNKKIKLLVGSIYLAAVSTNFASAETPKEIQTNGVEQEISLAKERVLKERPYPKSSYQGTGRIKISLKPFTQSMEEPPDWWSEKQGYDLSTLLGKVLELYPDLEVMPFQTWENHLIDQEASKLQDSKNPSQNTNTSISSIKAAGESNFSIAPSITGYSFKYLRPKKRGIGLGFIAITNKACTSESYIDTQYNITPFKTRQIEPELANGLAIESSLQISELIRKTTGGTSLNFNFLVGGAGGGGFEPPEKATKELIYNTLVDAAEQIHCKLINNESCLNYYSNRVKDKPTIEKATRRGVFGKKIDDTKRGC